MYEKNLQPSGATELKEEQLEHVSGGTEADLNVSVWNDDFVVRQNLQVNSKEVPESVQTT